MKFMSFIIHSPDIRVEKVPQALLDAMGKFVEEGLKSGALVDTAGLQPVQEAVTVRLKSGKLRTTDGPYTEAKEIIGGYAILEAKSKKEAVDLATKFMDLHRIHWPEFEGSCEVREIAAG